MKKILIIRNDKLGDFMLAYPSFALAKLNLQNTEIHALVPQYTKVMAESCSWIDKTIIDPGSNAGFLKNYSLIKKLKQENYDAAITLFSTSRIGLITRLAGIPYRLAPATKLAQIFYNHKLVQRRSRSEKTEYTYNMDLVFHFLKQSGIESIKEPNTPYLEFPKEEIQHLHQQFINRNNIPKNHKLIFIHAGSGGSANNMTALQFASLAKKLKSSDGHAFVITAGPGELDIANIIANELADIPHVVLDSKQGLLNFAKHIQFASLFIAGSTGPLHIAGALDTATVGFYPRRRSATSLRWQTLNSADKRLAFSPEEDAEQEDMFAINIELAAKKISEKFLMNK